MSSSSLRTLAELAGALRKGEHRPAGLLKIARRTLAASSGALICAARHKNKVNCTTTGLPRSLARRLRAAALRPPADFQSALAAVASGRLGAGGFPDLAWPGLWEVIETLNRRRPVVLLNLGNITTGGLMMLAAEKWPRWPAEFYQVAASLLSSKLGIDVCKEGQEIGAEDYRRIFEHSPDMIYLSSRDGRWVDVNPAGVAMLGYGSRDELLAVPDIAQDAYLRPEDRKPFQEAIERHGFVKDYEVTFKRKDGTPIEVSITGQVRMRGGEIQGYEGIIKDITARKRAEEAAAKERRRLERLLEVMPVAVFMVDKNHKVVHWNHACEVLTGYTREQMIGTSDVWKVFKRPKGVSLADVILSDDENLLLEVYGGDGRLRRSPISPDAWEAEAHFEDLGGRPKDLLFTAAVMRDENGQIDGAVEAILDTTDLMELERQLAESEQLYRNLVESSLDGIALSDGQGFIFANKHFLTIFGLDDLSQQQGGFLELLTPKSQQEYLKWIKGVDEVADGRRALGGGEGETFQGQGVRGEEVFDLELVAVDTRVGGRGARLYTVRDVTYRKTMEEQLISSERLAATGKLAFDIAHEVNNPLGGIMTFAYLLSEDLGPDHPLADTVAKIIKLTNRCKIIVRGLLDFAHQDGTEKELVDLNQVIEEMLILVDGHVIMKGVEVIKELDADLPRVYGLRSKLEQVFLNMVVNAAEAMEGQGELRITTWEDPESRLVMVRFKDNGPGIPEEVLPRLFEPFFTTKGRGRGTGLGLAISHGIIKQHAGRIMVETKAGEGTTFTVALPLSSPHTNPVTGQ